MNYYTNTADPNYQNIRSLKKNDEIKRTQHAGIHSSAETAVTASINSFAEREMCEQVFIFKKNVFLMML